VQHVQLPRPIAGAPGVTRSLYSHRWCRRRGVRKAYRRHWL